MTETQARAGPDLARIKRSVWSFKLDQARSVWLANPGQTQEALQATKQVKIGSSKPWLELVVQPHTPYMMQLRRDMGLTELKPHFSWVEYYD